MSQGLHFVIPALDSISGAFGQIFNDAMDTNFLKWDSFVALYGSQSDVFLIRQQFLGGLPKVTYQHRLATDCSSKQGHTELTNFFNRLHGTYEVDNQGINVFTVGPKCFIKAVMAEVGIKSTCSRKRDQKWGSEFRCSGCCMDLFCRLPDCICLQLPINGCSLSPTKIRWLTHHWCLW